VILDGRNLYDRQWPEDLGLAYQGIGRRNELALKRRRPFEAQPESPNTAMR
jgi:hypothetical protein